MSVRSLIAYPLQSPFYPEVLPFFKLLQDDYFENETQVQVGDSNVLITLPCAIPATAVVVFYSINLQNIQAYSAVDLRISSALYNRGANTVQFTLRARNFLAPLRVITDFNIQYYVPPA